MIRLLLLLLFLTSLAMTAAGAAPVIVRSGEHDSFTRLTIQLSGNVAWDLEDDGGEWHLRLGDTSSEFDFSQAFLRIGRDRIRGLSHGGSPSIMRIVLACDCDLRSFVTADNLLVIDVSDPAKPRPNDEFANSRSDRPAVELPIVLPRRLRNLVGGMIGPTFDTLGQHSPVVEKTDDMERVLTAEARLMEQFSRAATQGIIEMKPMAEAQMHADAEGQVEDVARKNPPELEATSSASVNLRAKTAIDVANEEPLKPVADAFDSRACFDDAQFEIDQWGWPQGAAAGIAHWRKQLFKEFDDSDPRAAQALALLYLHYGFGAEARVILSDAQLENEERDVLTSISYIIDLNYGNPTQAFAGQMSCDGPSALWALLEAPALVPQQRVNEVAVIAAFQRLPTHLKQHLGPELADRMIKLGKPEEAERVQRLLNQGMRHKSTHQELINAELSLLRDEHDTASEALRTVVASGNEVSPRALVALINADLRSGRRVPAETADLAAAYAVEYKTEPIGANLRRVHLLGRADARQFSRALQGLGEVEDRDGADAAQETREDILKLVADKASDQDFLGIMLTISRAAALKLRSPVADAVADRLILLGFPNEADQFLDAPTSDRRMRAMIAARADLARYWPQRALARLGEYSGEDVDELRAKARHMATDYLAAQSVYGALGLYEKQVNSAWLAGDWATLVETQDDVLAGIAQLELPSRPVVEQGDDAILQKTRELLDSSAASRDLLERLLDRMQMPSLDNGV